MDSYLISYEYKQKEGCEKDYLHCHRYLLAQYFMEKGIEWKEI